MFYDLNLMELKVSNFLCTCEARNKDPRQRSKTGRLTRVQHGFLLKRRSYVWTEGYSS